eukprot:gene4089-5837_t
MDNTNKKSTKPVPGDGWATNRKLNNKSSFLCSKNDIPCWHFTHRGIVGGYRKCETFQSALISLFYWHNESINIWMHYITSSLVLIISYYSFLWFGSDNIIPTAVIDGKFLFASVVIGNVIPMFLSAFCHQFYCVNRNWHKLCWFLDFIGILTGELSSSISFNYLVFYCDRSIFHILSVSVVVLYIISIYLCWRQYNGRLQSFNLEPKDRFPEFSKYLSIYGALASLLPVVLAVILKKEYILDANLRYVFLCSCSGPIIMALGIILFAQGHFPERFCKQWKLPLNYFDIIGHSHQWWHAVSAFLMLYWVFTLKFHYESRMKVGCQ